MWQKSVDTENEQAAFVYPDGHGGYAFNILASQLVKDRSFHDITFAIPENLPSGTILVHTHPDRQTLHNFGITRAYHHRPSSPDFKAIGSSNVEKGYILDPDQIIEYNSEAVIDRIDRCGY